MELCPFEFPVDPLSHQRWPPFSKAARRTRGVKHRSGMGRNFHSYRPNFNGARHIVPSLVIPVGFKGESRRSATEVSLARPGRNIGLPRDKVNLSGTMADAFCVSAERYVSDLILK